MKKKSIVLFGFLFLVLFMFKIEDADASSYYNTFVSEGDSWYYYDNNGQKAINSWIYTDAAYYVDENGKVTYGSKKIDGKVYNFDGQGRLTNDWIQFKNGQYQMASGYKFINKQFILGEKHYYYDENGYLLTGLFERDGKLYYFSNKDHFSNEFAVIENSWRYVNSDNSVATSQFINSDGKTYYVDSRGRVLYGKQVINGETYYFDNNGILQKGIIYLSDGWKIFKVDGSMAKNEFITIDHKTYFCNSLGNIVYGKKTINGKDYYFNDSGVMQSGIYFQSNGWKIYKTDGSKAVNEFVKVNGKTYYCNGSGNIVYGLNTVNGKKYYFNNSGEMQKGMLLVNNAWRYFDNNGVMKSGEWFTLNGKNYYAQKSGSLTYGEAKINGSTYYFDSTGCQVRNGLIPYKNGFKYLENGKFVTNQFRVINGNKYYFDNNGYRATGLVNYQGSLFYFDTNGMMQRNKFINVNGWRYFNDDGIMMKSAWLYLNDGIYYVDKNGFVLYGWQTIDGEDYFFDQTGRKTDILYGVDLSEHNGNVDWGALKSAGKSFAILRTSFGSYGYGREDYYFEQNYKNAIKNGFQIGVYHYAYASNVEEAIAEANHVLMILNGRNINMPIYYDVEDAEQANLSKAELSAMIDAFCTTIENAGYKAGVYSSLYWLNTKIDPWVLKGRDVWVAQWNDECTYTGDYSVWQYTSDGYIDGKRFDFNVWYKR